MSDTPKSSRGADEKKALLGKALAMVRRRARRMCSRHPSASYDDLVQAGSEAAIPLIDQYDPALNDSFEGYAWLRIRGAMTDLLRREQLAAPEPWRTAMRKAGDDVAEAAHDEGDVLKDTDEVTQGHLDNVLGGMSAAMAFVWFERARADRLMGLEAFLAREEYRDTMRDFEETFALLSEYHARILDLRWRQDLEFEQIAEILNVSCPTAHRHYAQAFTRLGNLLRVRGPTRAPPLDGIYEQPAW